MPKALTREDLDNSTIPTLVEFGAEYCSHCQLAREPVLSALSKCPGIAHVKVEDGPGLKLGRSYRVKLWPTLILLKSGQEVSRIVRPKTEAEVLTLLQQVK